jgi:(p)ppGpp synthase/HD superfamily hydrolase
MNLAQKHHTGRRKDGKTPEFEHQLVLVLYAINLAAVIPFLQLVIIVLFLHDLVEDYGYPLELIRKDFGDQVADSVDRMTKRDGVPETVYYARISEDLIAAICKAIDRIHNLSSMSGVFIAKKQRSYVREARSGAIAALKRAKRKFPEHTGLFNHLKHILLLQVEPIEAMLSGKQFRV